MLQLFVKSDTYAIYFPSCMSSFIIKEEEEKNTGIRKSLEAGVRTIDRTPRQAKPTSQAASAHPSIVHSQPQSQDRLISLP